MNFATLCDFLDNLRNSKGVAEKSKLAKGFWNSLREKNGNLLPVLRLVVPKLDRDRPSYRIKESKISRLVIKMLSLPQGSDKNLLMKSVMGSSIDFGDVVYSVLKKYIVNKEIGMTVEKINEYLDQIANRTTDTGLDDIVLEIFRKLSARNIRWLIQIILKELKLGMSDSSILNSFHVDGANFYATNNNLKKVCEVLADPKVKLNELEINIFEPFRPMLSKRIDASNFRKCFPDNSTFIIENKFDGERFQLHMEGENFKYFSRNSYDFTSSFGPSLNEGLLSPLLKNVFSPETHKLILDGEMMLWNKKHKAFGSKGLKFDVKKLKEGVYQPCFCVFDVLLHNDKILTNQPLLKRLQLLKNIVRNPTTGTIILSEYKVGNSREEIVSALNLSVDKNEEGIIVKDPKSVYKYSERNAGWFKLKMDYFDDVVHDLDLVVMGGSFVGANKINSFMVGVSSGPKTYLSFGQVSSGLNNEQLDMLNEKLRTCGLAFKHFSTKSEGQLMFGRDTPDIYIEPQHSVVFQVRASELTRTSDDSVKCPYTLRFPRVLKIRDDKPVEDCLSMNELLELTSTNKSVIKLNMRHIELDEIVAKTKAAKKIKLEVVKLGRVESGNFLNEMKINVQTGTQSWGVEDIYYCIKAAGGQASYRLDSRVDIVLTSKIIPKVNALMKEVNRFDIIHVDWLRRVLDQKKLVDYNYNEIFSLGAKFDRILGINFDRFGDSFTEEGTEESIEFICDMMKARDQFLNVNNAAEFISKPSLNQYTAYFDSFERIEDPDSKLIYYSLPDEAELQYYGGTVSKAISHDVNLVVMECCSGEREATLRRYLDDRGFYNVEIVTKGFIKQITS